MEGEKHYDDEIVQDADEYKKRFLTAENVDGDFCDGCQYRFKSLAEQEKYCKECIFYLLQEE